MNKEQLLKKLGKHIAALRTEKSISQAELARLCDKDPQSLNRLEKGRINPSIFFLYQISIELNIPLKEIVDFEK
jgi:putative transcriptional regulator